MIGGERIIKLLGQPHLADYLRFFRNRVVDGDAISPRVLAAEWKKANDIYYALLTEQAGIAETIEDVATAFRTHRYCGRACIS